MSIAITGTPNRERTYDAGFGGADNPFPDDPELSRYYELGRRCRTDWRMEQAMGRMEAQ